MRTGARLRHFEAVQQRVEEVVGAPGRPHPVAQHDEGGDLRAEPVEQCTELGVEALVDVSDAVGGPGRVPGVGGIVLVPELVAGAVRLTEHGDEEVPAAAVEHGRDDGGLGVHRGEHGVEQRRVLVGTPARPRPEGVVAGGAGPGVPVGEEVGDRVVSRIGAGVVQHVRRVAGRGTVAVVGAPVRDRDTPELRRGARRVGDVERRHLEASSVQLEPERLDAEGVGVDGH